MSTKSKMEILFIKSYTISQSAPAFALAFAMTTLLGLGCGVRPAEAPRTFLSGPTLSEYENRRLDFLMNSLFLWPDGVKPEQMSTVFQISQSLDKAGEQVAHYQARLKILEDRLSQTEDPAPLKLQCRKLDAEIKKLKAAVEGNRKLKDKKFEEINLEKTKPTPDQGLVDKLMTEADEIEKTLHKQEGDLGEKEQNRGQLANRIQVLESNPDRGEKEVIEAKKKQLEQNNLQDYLKLSQNVTVLGPPTQISLGTDASTGQPTVDIKGWQIDKDQDLKDFSSHPVDGTQPTIVRVQYTPLGGIYEFTVLVFEDPQQTRLKETYVFRIARLDPSESRGRVVLTGDLARLRTNSVTGADEIQYGIAKLVDRKN